MRVTNVCSQDEYKAQYERQAELAARLQREGIPPEEKSAAAAATAEDDEFS